ncbi:hypothetical protein [Geomesophilobacter sediminis]|uniref:Uncharacterized protein n=1 Tax=Geomesophilobacter sediminis TaxID=2798584 RepID=A0A8J7JL34_9BACT|nr:hypothetical protein [Geomesophilobacter sediminis]MBJ6724460.1 hypothetical protein [Geomesophilobacter sediminis]
MSRQQAVPTFFQEPEFPPRITPHPQYLREIIQRLAGGTGPSGAIAADRLPFAPGDATAGTETELQAVVLGAKENVDLPLTIEGSDYFANIVKRARSGETPRKRIAHLERFLNENREQVWENSWVRFSRQRLSPFAREVFDTDLLADKGNPAAGKRSDVARFSVPGSAGEQLRLPISYLLKLSLADLIGSRAIPASLIPLATRLMGHFLNDNTSPETFSFHVVPLTKETGMGRAVARETSKRFLFTHLLAQYANESFGLAETGQRALVHFAPHPPMRQKELNDQIADAFYRELFMSPCLSGWDRGEEKHRYMQLCHQVLSRSQLNAVAKLREAGIIVNNLVVLPNVSNVSLANNGTHVSLGSRRLGTLLSDPASGFTAAHEKYLGDLTIKMTEHFLPLFVGTYSAAPYRLGYTDFHPERALGFLPHELDYTHLRMLWRRWQKKASLSIFGQPVTPFGPPWIDRIVSGMFGLKGDFVPDFRLVDYLICLLSTPQSPALDGRCGNGDKLKRDLADLGVFDRQMSLYLLFKLREFGNMGFSGFEGRHYSQFDSLEDDLGRATDLQLLVTALAYKLMVKGDLSHRAIPDDPSLESERRQIFFASAIGVPTFFVRKGTRNRFLMRIVSRTADLRGSSRYPGYLRVKVDQYRLALLDLIKEEGADLIEMMDMWETVADLERRICDPQQYAASGKLTRGILEEVDAPTPMKASADEFNRGAERYYRGTLRRRHLEEGLRFLREDFRELDREAANGSGVGLIGLAELAPDGAETFLDQVGADFLADRLGGEGLRRLIGLTLLTVSRDSERAESLRKEEKRHAAPVHRAL